MENTLKNPHRKHKLIIKQHNTYLRPYFFLRGANIFIMSVMFSFASQSKFLRCYSHIRTVAVWFINRLACLVDNLVTGGSRFQTDTLFFLTVVGLAAWDNKTGHHRWKMTQCGAVCFNPESLFKNKSFNTSFKIKKKKIWICLFVFSRLPPKLHDNGCNLLNHCGSCVVFAVESIVKKGEIITLNSLSDVPVCCKGNKNKCNEIWISNIWCWRREDRSKGRETCHRGAIINTFSHFNKWGKWFLNRRIPSLGVWEAGEQWIKSKHS